MTRFRKSDIETHSAYRHGDELPAVNVKMYRGRGTSPPGSSVVEAKFGCTEQVAEQALGYATNSAQEQFWENAKDLALQYLGAGPKVWSAGRSGGWLVVDGLPPVESWDAVRVARWGRFHRAIEAEMAYQLGEVQILEAIDSNRWAEPGAEQYNFRDDEGGAQCVVDVKNAAVAAVPAVNRLLAIPL